MQNESEKRSLADPEAINFFGHKSRKQLDEQKDLTYNSNNIGNIFAESARVHAQGQRGLYEAEQTANFGLKNEKGQ